MTCVSALLLSLIELTVTRLMLAFAMIYAMCGIMLSLAANMESVASIKVGDKDLIAPLFGGIFPAFLSVILIGRSEVKKAARAGRDIDHWGLLLAGCPAVLKYLFWGSFIYAWALGMVVALWQPHEPGLMRHAAVALCMTFYAMGLATTTAAYLRRR